MNATQFNPVLYKTTTQQQWQSAAKAWNDWGDTLGIWLGPATETMLDMARVNTGARVLDVAAGAGGQSLQAAVRSPHRRRRLCTRHGHFLEPSRLRCCRGTGAGPYPGGGPGDGWRGPHA